MSREKPGCYFCSVRGAALKRVQFHVTIAHKLVLERHLVCEQCSKARLAYTWRAERIDTMKPEEKNPGIIDLSSITRPDTRVKDEPVKAPIPTERALIVVSDQAPKEKKS